MRSHIFLFGSLPRRRPPESTATLMFEFWREATATSFPGLLYQSGRGRLENVSILSSLFLGTVTSFLQRNEFRYQVQITKPRYMWALTTMLCFTLSDD